MLRILFQSARSRKGIFPGTISFFIPRMLLFSLTKTWCFFSNTSHKKNVPATEAAGTQNNSH